MITRYEIVMRRRGDDRSFGSVIVRFRNEWFRVRAHWVSQRADNYVELRLLII